MKWIVQFQDVKGRWHETEPFVDRESAAMFASTIPMRKVNIFPINDEITHVTELKDGRIMLEIAMSAELLTDEHGKGTTFLYMSPDQLENIYKELGHYLFEESLKGESRS